MQQIADVNGFSRFPVADGHGELTGYVHVKDILVTDAASHRRPANPDLVRALPSVRQNDRLRHVLTTMQSTRSHLARVADDAGVTVGIVALEDVLEELVDEVRDESRRSAPVHR